MHLWYRYYYAIIKSKNDAQQSNQSPKYTLTLSRSPAAWIDCLTKRQTCIQRIAYDLLVRIQ